MHFWPCSASQSLSAIGFWSCSPVLQVPELLQKLPALALQLARLLLFMCNRPLLRIPCSKVTKHLTSAPFDFIFPRSSTIFYMFYHVLSCFYMFFTSSIMPFHPLPQSQQRPSSAATCARSFAKLCAASEQRCDSVPPSAASAVSSGAGARRRSRSLSSSWRWAASSSARAQSWGRAAAGGQRQRWGGQRMASCERISKLGMKCRKR